MSRADLQHGVVHHTRGLLLAGCSGAITTAAHSLADGQISHVPMTVLLAMLIGWICVGIAEHARGVPGVLLVLGSAQLITHLILDGLSGHSSTSPAMIISHAVATLLIAALLAYTEATLSVALRALRLLILVMRWPSPAPMTSSALRPAVRAAGTLVVEVLLHRIHRRRGPPNIPDCFTPHRPVPVPDAMP